MKLGSYIHIGPGCSVIGGKAASFTMEDFSGLSAGCRIACSTDDYLGSGLTNPTVPPGMRAKVTIGTVVMRKHSLLGTGCVVHPNVVIGEGSVVGSLGLVRKTLDPWGVYVGIPAVWIKTRASAIILMHEHGLMPDPVHDPVFHAGVKVSVKGEIRYTQDFGSHKGAFPGVVFTVQESSGERLKLVGYGYGLLNNGDGAYGSGAIHVGQEDWNKLQVEDTIAD